MDEATRARGGRQRGAGGGGREAGRSSAPEAAGCDTRPRSPRYRHSECCANDCVFMAVKLLQVLVLGVFAAAADDGALFCVVF